ncbi:MAG TPA: hypothetical protein DCZ49_05690 [Hyphomonadaceae bacterium]|jgi:Putative translation initiation inhibitor, yjgF family|nr:hypothetical protein [Hyphomonadaceae bacterium]
MPNRRRISSGSAFEAQASYSRAIVSPDAGGDWVFVSGTTGFDYKTGAIAEKVEDQARQAFRNIQAALNLAGASIDDMVRVRVFLASGADFAKIAPVLSQYCRTAKPANTTLVTGFIDPRILVEIEATARIPHAGRIQGDP